MPPSVVTVYEPPSLWPPTPLKLPCGAMASWPMASFAIPSLAIASLVAGGCCAASGEGARPKVRESDRRQADYEAKSHLILAEWRSRYS